MPPAVSQLSLPPAVTQPAAPFHLPARRRLQATASARGLLGSRSALISRGWQSLQYPFGAIAGGAESKPEFRPLFFRTSGEAHFDPFGASLGAELSSEIQCFRMLRNRSGLANLSLNSSSGSYRYVHKGLLGGVKKFSAPNVAWNRQSVPQFILQRLQMCS